MIDHNVGSSFGHVKEIGHLACVPEREPVAPSDTEGADDVNRGP